MENNKLVNLEEVSFNTMLLKELDLGFNYYIFDYYYNDFEFAETIEVTDNDFLEETILAREDMHRIKMIEREYRGIIMPLFSVGDILRVSYVSKFITYGFEGICICVRKKNLDKFNASFVLRNVLSGVGIEFTISYFGNRAYNFGIADHGRKEFYYRRSKLFYLRKRLNRASKVNF